jgi:epsilon-lactone hydrolase
MSSNEMLQKLVSLLRERRLPADTPVAEQRAAMELAVAKIPLAQDVDVASGELAGRPVERFTPHNRRTAGTVLYFHGGGYVMGSLLTIRAMASYLCSAAGAEVITLDYRLAPEHPYPAAIDDAVAAYIELVDQEGISSDKIAFAGDSAGGGLVLATLISLRDRGRTLPAGGVCISPWTDLTLTAASIDRNAELDPQITREALTIMAGQYLAQTAATNPTASPVFANYEGLSPLLIQVGGAEGLVDDSHAVADQARRADVDVTLEVWPDMIHVWHAFVPRFPPAMEAWSRIAEWLHEKWGPASS